MIRLPVAVFILLCAVCCAIGFPHYAFAQAGTAGPPVISAGDTAWMLTSTALVLLMTIPGLALFYGGMVRKMNVLATCMQSFAITCLVAVLWVVVGYSLAFTDGSGGMAAYLGDFSRLFLRGMPMDDTPFLLGGALKSATQTTIPESVYMMFQMTFAIITPALIAGAFADRMKFSAMLWFMGLWSIFVYVPIAHWVWQPHGFLADKGVLDFAGGTVVHINAGIAGLVSALVLGKRLGYPSTPFTPHNLVLSLIGASLLWVGWFGFNAGSALAANGRAGMAMVATMVATAIAGLAWMSAEWLLKGKPSVLGIISGAVAGLVAITPASGYVDPMGALIIGALAGVVCFFAATTLKHAMGYDDSLDAFGVHGVGGIVGALLTGFLARSALAGKDADGNLIAGWIESGSFNQVIIQLEAIATTVIYCGVMSFIILKLVDLVIGLRVDADMEREGLDVGLHGEAVQ